MKQERCYCMRCGTEFWAWSTRALGLTTTCPSCRNPWAHTEAGLAAYVEAWEKVTKPKREEA